MGGTQIFETQPTSTRSQPGGQAEKRWPRRLNAEIQVSEYWSNVFGLIRGCEVSTRLTFKLAQNFSQSTPLRKFIKIFRKDGQRCPVIGTANVRRMIESGKETRRLHPAPYAGTNKVLLFL